MAIDKRITKTRNAIKSSFMTLMLDKDINKITVSDITEGAMINRSTFYLHYEDINAVMVDIEHEIEQKITQCFEQFDSENIYESTYTLLTNLTSTLNEMPEMNKFILYSTNSKHIAERLKEIFVEKSMIAYNNSHSKIDPDRYHYGITFISSGVIDTYIKWSLSQEKNITLSELCSYLGELAEVMIKILNA
jgi:AcrR family transcriptional regulator